ncbi:MAG: hypothetical protein U9P12_09515, partial [Verrucomicrobiota bacterium]|nr:hypothetical protein [Verrucomicrobiota bacterium]
DVATVTVDVPAGTHGWVEFPINAVLDSPSAWLYLDADTAARWQCRETALPGRFRIYRGADLRWIRVDGSGMSIRFDPGSGAVEMWKASNVVNGFAHSTKEVSNMWESSPKETVPQWIELKLSRPSKVGAIQCVFDTDLTMPLARQGEARPSVCVRDYTLECWVDGAWKRVVRERDNVQRFRRHRFVQLTTGKIRLTVEATHGAKTARVLEMRVYES